MNSRLSYVLGIAIAAALLWMGMAKAQVQVELPAGLDGKIIQIQLPQVKGPAKASQQEELKKAQELLAKALQAQQVQIQLQQPGQPGVQPAPAVPKAAPAGDNEIAQAKDLARQIDELINKKLKVAKVKAAPTASDTEFFRRLHLDLSGQIPTLLDTRDFLDNKSPDKRSMWIEQLLESDNYPVHFAYVWSGALLGNRLEAGLIGPRQSFAKWMQDRLRQNQGYDVTVKEVLMQVRKPGEIGAPNAFINFYGNKAEEQSGAVARAFLGIKIECAQCHPHPFADWSKEQFWEFTAFLSPQAIKPAGNGNFQRPVMTIPGGTKKAKATFLDGTAPPEVMPENPKATLANWMVSKDNPYFAKAAADHVWSYFFGVSLLEPLMEKVKGKAKKKEAEEEKAAFTHPDLLNLLAKELADHNFDVKHLVRAIVYTEAYQRTSVGPKDDDLLALFGKMPVRALSADQLYDSFMIATNTKGSQPSPQALDPNFNPFNPFVNERGQFVLKFTDTAKATESSTSILQALYLMNGKFLNERLNATKNGMISVLANTPGNAQRQIETLYLMSLSRQPTAKELEQLIPYVNSGGATGDRTQALADVFWALLNSSEFAANH